MMRHSADSVCQNASHYVMSGHSDSNLRDIGQHARNQPYFYCKRSAVVPMEWILLMPSEKVSINPYATIGKRFHTDQNLQWKDWYTKQVWPSPWSGKAHRRTCMPLKRLQHYFNEGLERKENRTAQFAPSIRAPDKFVLKEEKHLIHYTLYGKI